MAEPGNIQGCPRSRRHGVVSTVRCKRRKFRHVKKDESNLKSEVRLEKLQEDKGIRRREERAERIR